MNKWENWYKNLPESTKTYLKNQPIWYDRDLYKFLGIGVVIGFVVGFLVGYESAWSPVIQTFRPLVG